MGVVNDAVRGRTLKIECSGLSINFLSTLNTIHSTFVRPPRGRSKVVAVSPQAALHHGFACIGLSLWSLHEALLSQR